MQCSPTISIPIPPIFPFSLPIFSISPVYLLCSLSWRLIFSWITLPDELDVDTVSISLMFMHYYFPKSLSIPFLSVLPPILGATLPVLQYSWISLYTFPHQGSYPWPFWGRFWYITFTHPLQIFFYPIESILSQGIYLSTGKSQLPTLVPLMGMMIHGSLWYH